MTHPNGHPAHRRELVERPSSELPAVGWCNQAGDGRGRGKCGFTLSVDEGRHDDISDTTHFPIMYIFGVTSSPRSLRPSQTGIPVNPSAVVIDLHGNSWRFPRNPRLEWSRKTLCDASQITSPLLLFPYSLWRLARPNRHVPPLQFLFGD